MAYHPYPPHEHAVHAPIDVVYPPAYLPDSLYSLQQSSIAPSVAHAMSIADTDQPYLTSPFVWGSNPDATSSRWQPYHPLSLDPPHAGAGAGYAPHVSPPPFQTPATDYPESSQRTVLPDPSAPSSSSVRSSLVSSASSSDLQRSLLYTIDSDPPSPPRPSAIHLPHSPSPSPAPPVKSEPADAESGFIFELSPPSPPAHNSGLAPLAEVPLRATNASAEMRKMMGAFRLDSFVMHNGIRGAAVAAGPLFEAGPLTEEPVIVEFQVYLEYPLVSPSPPPSPPPVHAQRQSEWYRSPSPASSLYAGAYDAFDDVRKWSLGAAVFDYPSSPVDAPSPPFAPLLNPAQGLQWSMQYDAGSATTIPTPAQMSLSHSQQQNQHRHTQSQFTPDYNPARASVSLSQYFSAAPPPPRRHAHAFDAHSPSSASSSSLPLGDEFPPPLSQYARPAASADTYAWYRRSLALAAECYPACA